MTCRHFYWVSIAVCRIATPTSHKTCLESPIFSQVEGRTSQALGRRKPAYVCYGVARDSRQRPGGDCLTASSEAVTGPKFVCSGSTVGCGFLDVHLVQLFLKLS
jgi:hypothetical protein